ncbi:luciferase [Entophlyctis helioformis]|nr:luciferase [Entophlyctis helioformis]
MVGYHNNPEATAASIDADGYFHTGDVAVISADGHLTIVDRLKELIKYAGLQVPPAELEGKLLMHPKIADAAVIGRPDEAVGELPLAFVVLKPEQTATEAEIQTFIADHVAQHKQLRGGVQFIDAIPRAASGKILRRVLRDKLAAGSAQQ